MRTAKARAACRAVVPDFERLTAPEEKSRDRQNAEQEREEALEVKKVDRRELGDDRKKIEWERRVSERDLEVIVTGGQREMEVVFDQVGDHDIKQPAIVERKVGGDDRQVTERGAKERDRQERHP